MAIPVYAGKSLNKEYTAERKCFAGAVESKDIALLHEINRKTMHLEHLINCAIDDKGWLVSFRAKRVYTHLSNYIKQATERVELYTALLTEIRPVTEQLQTRIEELNRSADKLIPDSPQIARQQRLLELNSRLLTSYTSRTPKIQMYVAKLEDACDEAKAVCEFYKTQQHAQALSLKKLSRDLKQIVDSKQRIHELVRELPAPKFIGVQSS